MSDSEDIGARENIMKLLSDDENAKVSNAEAKPLPAGEEYVDLDDLEAGVQTATPEMTAEDASGSRSDDYRRRRRRRRGHHAQSIPQDQALPGPKWNGPR